jgi:hypothetical protein
MEHRRLLCRDGRVYLYRAPLEIERDRVGFTDANGSHHWVLRADVREISVESGGGAHPDDEEVAGVEQDQGLDLPMDELRGDLT